MLLGLVFQILSPSVSPAPILPLNQLTYLKQLVLIML